MSMTHRHRHTQRMHAPTNGRDTGDTAPGSTDTPRTSSCSAIDHTRRNTTYTRTLLACLSRCCAASALPCAASINIERRGETGGDPARPGDRNGASLVVVAAAAAAAVAAADVAAAACPLTTSSLTTVSVGSSATSPSPTTTLVPSGPNTADSGSSVSQCARTSPRDRPLSVTSSSAAVGRVVASFAHLSRGHDHTRSHARAHSDSISHMRLSRSASAGGVLGCSVGLCARLSQHTNTQSTLTAIPATPESRSESRA
jgi:hypothetical protein